MIDNAPTRAKALFESGYYCAESVLLAASESLEVSCDAIPRIATGLCSGVARTGGLCGALLGGILAIGLGLGRDRSDESVEPVYDAVASLLKSFSDRYGATSCGDLTGCDLGTDEGQVRFRETSQHERCEEYVAMATELALQEIAVRRPTA